jgi:hypothetical protein
MAPLPPDFESDASHEGVPEVIEKSKTGDWNTETGNAALSDDEHMMDRDYTGMFEGPEKNLEVVFRKMGDEHTDTSSGELFGTDYTVPNQRVGLRRLERDDLDLICSRARCTILSSISNQYLDAYVLSESSLFVYPYMLVLKTCGTTTLLRVIATLIALGGKLGLEIDWVGSRRSGLSAPVLSSRIGLPLRTSQFVRTSRRKRLHSGTCQW